MYECPEIFGIYGLNRFWKGLNPMQQNNLRNKLKQNFDLYIEKYKGNNFFNNEPPHALCICPEGHKGTNSRLISIQDPRKNKKGVVCIDFSERHGDKYNNKISAAQDTYRAFREVTFATEQELDEFQRQNKSKYLKPLIYVGFYRVIFEQSKDIYKINNQNREILNQSRKDDLKNEIYKMWYGLQRYVYGNKITHDEKKSKCDEFLNHFRNKYGYNWEKFLTNNTKNIVDNIKNYII